jgi:ABC-type transport system involved in multi-copper enzyme maturation permease subunit
MTGTLIIKEIHENILNIRFLVVSLLCIILVPAGMYVALKDYEYNLEDYNVQVKSYIEKNEGRVNRNFTGELYRPPSPLSIFSQGLDVILPYDAIITSDEDPKIETRSAWDNPLTPLFGKIDFSFIATYILSILAFIFTFNSVSGEKENGTLRLMTSNDVPRWKILLSKVLGNYLVFIFPFLVSLLTGLLIVNFSGNYQLFSQDILLPVIFILLTTMLFLFVLFNLGILFSTITSNSASSLIMLLFIWVLIALVIPKISPMVAQVIYPVESRQTVNTEKMLARQSIEQELIGQEREIGEKIFGSGLTVTANRDQRQEEYNELVAPLREEYNRQINSELSKIESAYQNRRKKQTAISVNLARLSPASSLSVILAEFSGTGTLEDMNFRVHADRFNDLVKNEVYDYYITNRYYTKNGSGSSSRLKEGAPEEFPVSQYSDYQHVSLSRIIDTVWIDILVLGLYAVIFFVLAFISFIRYDVR